MAFGIIGYSQMVCKSFIFQLQNSKAGSWVKGQKFRYFYKKITCMEKAEQIEDFVLISFPVMRMPCGFDFQKENDALPESEIAKENISALLRNCLHDSLFN